MADGNGGFNNGFSNGFSIGWEVSGGWTSGGNCWACYCKCCEYATTPLLVRTKKGFVINQKEFHKRNLAKQKTMSAIRRYREAVRKIEEGDYFGET